MNYFLIGGDKKEYGPATSDEIRQWVKEGRANGETMLRPDGETVWKPLNFFPEFADLQAVVQAPSSPPPIPRAIDLIVPADAPMSIGHAFGRAWHLVNEHFGTLVGACFLAWMAVTGLLLFPVIGPFLEMLFFGPIFGGLFLVFLKVIREGDASAGEVFSLARGNTGQLIFVHLFSTIVIQLVILCFCLPSLYLQVAWIFGIPLVADRKLDFWNGLELSRRAVTRRWFKFCGLFILAFLPVIVFQIYFSYQMGTDVFPITEKILRAATAGELSVADVNAFKEQFNAVARNYAWWLLIKQALLFVSMPLGIGSFAFLYEDLFGRKR
jgi:hypothetical protein